MIHGIFQVHLTVFPQSLSKFPLVYLLAWHLHFILHTFLQVIIVFFSQHIPVPKLSSNHSLSLNPLLGILSCSFTPYIYLTILIFALALSAHCECFIVDIDGSTGKKTKADVHCACCVHVVLLVRQISDKSTQCILQHTSSNR